MFTRFLLGLAEDLSDGAAGHRTWATTVVLADRMRLAGRRGPFEQLMRRVTYITVRGVSSSAPETRTPR